MDGLTTVNPMLYRDKTVINNEIDSYSQTIINPEINSSGSTIINPVLTSLVRIQKGKKLNGKYKVLNRLETETGEADLYVCEYENHNYIAKVYRRDHTEKNEITELLRRIKCPYLAPVIDLFDFEGLQIEVLPYYKRGSLQGVVLSEEQLKNTVIPDLIEGLKVLHDHDVLHKDIKPSNIMWTDDGEDVVIIDFGISSLLEGNTLVKTQTGLTLEYAAPETLKGIYSPLSDYYSLGITIYELLFGKTPYRNMTKEEVEEFSIIQNIPLPEKLSESFRDLLRGLTYLDIKNRKDETNPNCRWGYQKVKAWCEGKKQVVPGTGFGGISGDMPQYRFRGTTYSTREDLTRALVLEWDAGMAELFRGRLVQAFESFDQKTAELLEKHEREYSDNQELADEIFWKALYDINAGTYEFYWKNTVFKSLSDLGQFILDGFRADDFKKKRLIEEIIRHNIISNYIITVDPDNKDLYASVRALEKRYIEADNNREINLSGFIMGYMISADDTFYLDKQQFSSVHELINYILRLKSQSIDQFEIFCKKIIKYNNELSPQFEAWLVASGKMDVIQKWKQLISQ